MRTYHDTRGHWWLFFEPSSQELDRIIERIAERPDIKPIFEVADFFLEKRFLFRIEGYSREALINFFYGEL